jgi:hypothetical protein
LAMCSTVEHGHVKAGRACRISRMFRKAEDRAALSRHEDLHRAVVSTLRSSGAIH